MPVRKTFDYLLFVADRFPVVFTLNIFLAGILFWGGFNTAMESTNTLSFCVGCHEMRSTVFEEYRTTIHYQNPTGIRAACPDCHVPREWGYKVIRKVSATNELFYHLTGSIDTAEKFEARRGTLAALVWEAMQSTDSRECRNCHTIEYMDIDGQEVKSAIFHRYAKDNHITCIHCHKGIAHRLPSGYVDEAYEKTLNEMHEVFEREDQECAICHEQLNDKSGGWYD